MRLRKRRVALVVGGLTLIGLGVCKGLKNKETSDKDTVPKLPTGERMRYKSRDNQAVAIKKDIDYKSIINGEKTMDIKETSNLK